MKFINKNVLSTIFLVAATEAAKTTTTTTTKINVTLASDSCWSESKGYPCCKGCDVVTYDRYGSWGIENGQWCGIKKEECHVGDTCWSSFYGYECCKGCKVKYVDDLGSWGYESG